MSAYQKERLSYKQYNEAFKGRQILDYALPMRNQDSRLSSQGSATQLPKKIVQVNYDELDDEDYNKKRLSEL